MYAQILNGSMTTFDALPFRVTLADGTTRTSLSELSETQLAEIGVYPVVGTAPEHDASTQRLVGPTLTLDGDHVDATWTVEGLSTEEIASILSDAKAAKIAEIQAASDAAIAQLESGYTQGEIKSFDRQRQGAIDILAENATTADAQYVAALAAARAAAGDAECTTAWLAQRIKENADTAAAYTIAILGKQQGLEATVRAAETVAEVEAVTW